MATLSFKAEQNQQMRTTTITFKTLQNFQCTPQCALFGNIDKNIKVKGDFHGIPSPLSILNQCAELLSLDTAPLSFKAEQNQQMRTKAITI